MKIQESGENYLEAILVLKKEKGKIRSIDIARHLEFTKPSVSRAVNLLKTNEYITIDKEGWIELTETGLAIAEKVLERHSFVSRWLISIGVPEDIAKDDACRIEHDINDITFSKIKEFVLKNLEMSIEE